MTLNTPRHYLACSYCVSQYQTIRSFAEDLSIKFGKSLEEIRLWMKCNDVSTHLLVFSQTSHTKI
jgi:hypothetical protein